jgi:hypothetical protein
MRQIAIPSMSNSAYVGCHMKFGWKSLESDHINIHLDSPSCYRIYRILFYSLASHQKGESWYQ